MLAFICLSVYMSRAHVHAQAEAFTGLKLNRRVTRFSHIVPGVWQTFLCDAFVFDDGSAENDYSQTYRTYLHDDYSLECSTGEYARSRDWAYALIALWPVGVPLLYSTVLAASRKADTARGPSKLSRAVGFLHRDYKPRFFWWEVRILRKDRGVNCSAGQLRPCEDSSCPIELVRKLCLTGVPLLIDTTAELARVVVALCVHPHENPNSILGSSGGSALSVWARHLLYCFLSASRFLL
eukprot:6191359-Pleurochrysis_carterae.AAC.12